jgi:hypothetical protein
VAQKANTMAGGKLDLLPVVAAAARARRRGRHPPFHGRGAHVGGGRPRAAGTAADDTCVLTAIALGFQVASWKMRPRVWRWPERRRLTPWRMFTR